jgi:glyoxylase-like metal-dependent hydrolase (beta-lactamase superfamily II)
MYWTGLYSVGGVLVDSGPPNIGAEAARLFRELAPRACVTTHHHEDHIGNHALLAGQFNVVPLIHPRGIARVANPERLHLYRRVAWGRPAPARCHPLGDWFEMGPTRFQVVHTPGHSDDHVVFFEPDRRWMFTGDLYLGPRLKYVRADEDVHALMASLRRAIALEPKVLFCQHRGRIERGTAALQEKLDAMSHLQGTIERLHAGGRSPAEIARAIPGSDLVWRVWTGGHFSKLNFVRAILRECADCNSTARS